MENSKNAQNSKSGENSRNGQNFKNAQNSQNKNSTNKNSQNQNYLNENPQNSTNKISSNQNSTNQYSTSQNYKNVVVENHSKQRKISNLERAVLGLAISTGILAATTLGLGIAYGVTQSQANQYGLQLENIYQKNYYELVDSVNNTDMKISKILASDSQIYQAKTLAEVAQECKDIQSNIAALPLAGDQIEQSVRFINQISGYTQILEEKIAKGGSLSENDLQTLREIHESLTQMKRYLNQMSLRMAEGYNIMEASSRSGGSQDDFSLDFAGIKADDTDYPTMIYDGPFSDSVLNAQVKGLRGGEVSKDDAFKKVDGVFKNVSGLKYEGQTDGKFQTYNFNLLTTDGTRLYVQVTKIGGNILTVSGNVESDQKNVESAQAEKIALDFAKANGVENATIVWKDELEDQSYFNIAPKQNGIVLYPDLVKVKVDLEHGTVIGYDAVTYFTNHTPRQLAAGGIGIDLAREKVDKSFVVVGQRLVLAPLDYNREVLCYEFECHRDGATYYLYYNAATGVQENVLKVVETTDGNKLI